MNYNEPMSYEQIKRKGERWVRKTYNNIIATNNLVNICNVKSSDLELDNNYCNILTYSYPCQDLSLAGKQKGMEKSSGTRSALLWEVDRILHELPKEDLPQMLLMENVPQCRSGNNLKDFIEWQNRLEKLGYKNYYQNLNAKDYGIPQNRNRTFMVSILGDYYYEFPKKIKLELRLKDMLEDNVDESYYLSDKQIKDIENWECYEKPLEDIEQDRICSCITTKCGHYSSGMQLVEDLCIDHKSSERFNGSRNDGICGTLITSDKFSIFEKKEKLPDVIGKYTKGGFNGGQILHENSIAPTFMENHGNVMAILNNLRIRKLTEKECFRLMGLKDIDIDNVMKNQSKSSCYHLAGDSIVVNVLMAIFKNLQ